MIKNQVKLGAILSYCQIFLGMLISISINRIVVQKLGLSEVGILNLATNVMSYLNLLTLGLGSAFIRFHMKYRVKNDIEGEQKLNGMYFRLFSIISLIMAICGTILIVITPKIFLKLTSYEVNMLRIVMGVSLLQTCLLLPFNVYTYNINAYEKFVFAKLIGIINTVIVPIFKLVVVVLGLKSFGVVLSTLILSTIAMIVQVVYAHKVLKIRLKFGKLDKHLLKAIYSFSFFVFLNQIIDMLNWQIDSMVLGIVSGTAAVAIYSMGASFNSYMMNFSTAISSVLVPRVNKMVANGCDKNEINDLFIKTGRIQFIILALILTGFIFFGKDFIIHFYATEEYNDSYYVALLLIVPLIIPLIQNLGVEIQRAYNKHKFRSIAYAVMAIINVAMSVPLGIYFGPIGCALGTCISLLVANGIVMNIYYHKVLGLNMFKFWFSILKFLPAFICPIAFGVACIIFVDLSNLLWFLLCILGYVFLYCLSMYVWGMNESERNIIRNFCRKIFKKCKVKQ